MVLALLWLGYRHGVELEFDERKGVLHSSDSVVHFLHSLVHFPREVIQEAVRGISESLESS